MSFEMILSRSGFVIYRCKYCDCKTKRLRKMMRHLARCTQTQLERLLNHSN
jgi:hypothetical protein